MIRFVALNPEVTPDHLGLIPMFLSEDSDLPAREQFDNNYAHGGGWHPMSGWTLDPDFVLHYEIPDEEEQDPPLKPLAVAKLRDEVIIVYPYAWVAIVQPDRSFEVSRMD